MDRDLFLFDLPLFLARLAAMVFCHVERYKMVMKTGLIANRTNNKTLDTAICYTSGAHTCFIINAPLLAENFHAIEKHQRNTTNSMISVDLDLDEHHAHAHQVHELLK